MITIQELISSETAKRFSIDNTPNKKHLRNLNIFLKKCLIPLENEWNKYCTDNNLKTTGIRIVKGYVSDELGKKISEPKSSMHLIGLAVDTMPYSEKINEYETFLKEYFKNKKFDQIIEESPRNGIPSWIHIGYKNENNLQRKQIFRLI